MSFTRVIIANIASVSGVGSHPQSESWIPPPHYMNVLMSLPVSSAFNESTILYKATKYTCDAYISGPRSCSSQ